MRSRLALLGTVPLIVATGAAADEAAPDADVQLRRGAEILLHVDGERERSGWLADEMGRFHFQKGAGIAYNRPISFGARGTEVGFWAGRVRGRTYGLAVEVRF